MHGEVFFLTAKHAFDNTEESKLYAKDFNGRRYPIGKRYTTWNDIALCKLNSMMVFSPMFTQFIEDIYIDLSVVKKGAIVPYGVGNIRTELDEGMYKVKGTSDTEYSLPGDSGAPVVRFTNENELVGIHLLGNNEGIMPDNEFGLFVSIKKFFEENPEYFLIGDNNGVKKVEEYFEVECCDRLHGRGHSQCGCDVKLINKNKEEKKMEKKPVELSDVLLSGALWSLQFKVYNYNVLKDIAGDLNSLKNLCDAQKKARDGFEGKLESKYFKCNYYAESLTQLESIQAYLRKIYDVVSKQLEMGGGNL
jgi:hypothetical protein